MIKGLYSAVSAMVAAFQRQGALTHNIANVDTPGFKQLLVTLQNFTETAVATPPSDVISSPGLRSLGLLGLGVEVGPEETDHSDGGLRNTDHQYDLAIQGPGFFRIQTPDGERYTRDGRFSRDASGRLVTVDGYAVLNRAGSTITLAYGGLSVAEDGTLAVDGVAAGQLGLAAFETPEQSLVRDLPNAYRATTAPTTAIAVMVRQGCLEDSNVNIAEVMTQMVAVARAYEAAQQLVQVQDDLLGRTISTLGRV